MVNPSPISRRLLWHLFRVGHAQFFQRTRFAPRTKPGAGLFTIESGHGSLKLESGAWPLNRGPQFWMCSTHETIEVIPHNEQTLVTHGITFGGPALDAWLEELGVAGSPVFTLPNSSVARRALRSLGQVATLLPAGNPIASRRPTIVNVTDRPPGI